MKHLALVCHLWVVAVLVVPADEIPDIRSVDPDLAVPKFTTAAPAPGLRVKQTHPDYAKTNIYHALYLPTDWKPGETYPVIVEYAGNGSYKSPHGDVSRGIVEGSNLGYGLSSGAGYIWVCLPYLNATSTENVPIWWGNKPNYDATPTVNYCLKTVPWICKEFGGKPDYVILCGFSRGAIACNFIGLYDDRIAKLWRAFIPYSHYDGVRKWVPNGDRNSASQRLMRLGNRRQFILQESTPANASLAVTKAYLQEAAAEKLAQFQFLETGFRNHNDAWILRPSPAREKVRDWLASIGPTLKREPKPKSE